MQDATARSIMYLLPVRYVPGGSHSVGLSVRRNFRTGRASSGCLQLILDFPPKPRTSSVVVRVWAQLALETALQKAQWAKFLGSSL